MKNVYITVSLVTNYKTIVKFIFMKYLIFTNIMMNFCPIVPINLCFKIKTNFSEKLLLNPMHSTLDLP